MQRTTKAGVLQMKTRKIQKKNLLQAICSNQLGYIHKQFEDLEETNTEKCQWAVSTNQIHDVGACGNCRLCQLS